MSQRSSRKQACSFPPVRWTRVGIYLLSLVIDFSTFHQENSVHYVCRAFRRNRRLTSLSVGSPAGEPFGGIADWRAFRRDRRLASLSAGSPAGEPFGGIAGWRAFRRDRRLASLSAGSPAGEPFGGIAGWRAFRRDRRLASLSAGSPAGEPFGGIAGWRAFRAGSPAGEPFERALPPSGLIQQTIGMKCFSSRKKNTKISVSSEALKCLAFNCVTIINISENLFYSSPISLGDETKNAPQGSTGLLPGYTETTFNFN